MRRDADCGRLTSKTLLVPIFDGKLVNERTSEIQQSASRSIG
jgi:hypothetical protein